MKKLKKIINKFSIIVDIIFFVILIPSTFIMLLFRKFGSHKLPYSKSLLNKIGVFPLLDHYYEPQFNYNKNKINFEEDRFLPGLDFEIENQLKNLAKLNYSDELIKMNFIKGSPNYNFKLNNNFFEAGDSEIYYQIIRYLKPSKIIEIGSGYSTLVALEAARENLNKDKKKIEITCIEPYENSWLQNYDLNIIKKNIEYINLDIFKNLNSNDLLFIDSSHMIRPFGDVLRIYLEILPILKSGVMVHIHDIRTPKNYSNRWLVNENKFWNEQYLVESFMMNKNRYEIFLLLNYLKNKEFLDLKNKCPYLLESSDPGSLYLKIN